MSNRYFVEREPGADWSICEYVKGRKIVKASGLDAQEADETAQRWNEDDSKEEQSYVG